MSEEWNGVKLAEVRLAFIQRLGGTLESVARLIDLSQNVDYTFDTATNGSVIVSNYYTTWEFVAPLNYVIAPAPTVGGFMDNLTAATSANPVPAWDDFAQFLNGKRSTINSSLTENGAATITDAQGHTYAGTQHLLPEVSSFPDLSVWLKTWFGSDFLTASSAVVSSGNNVEHFILAANGVSIDCTFRL